MNPENVKRGKANRRKGNTAQREWAQRIEGKNIGRLGEADVLGPDGTLWEVKSLAKLRESDVLNALAQIEVCAADYGRDYGLAWRLPNRSADKRWLVIRYG